MIPVAYNNSVWLAEPSHLHRLAVYVAGYERCYTMREVAESHRESMMRAKGISADAIQAGGITYEMEAKLAAGQQVRAVKGKVGVIPVHGPIEQRMSSTLMKSGGTSTEFISQALDALLTDSSIGAIVLHVDSPGGGIYGVQEISDKIYASRKVKPIFAIADSLAASASYWIATSAGMMVATPGADVGSVGVFALHIDQSGKMEKDGIKVTPVSAGRYKTELSPFGPLGEDALNHQQDVVDALYGRFLTALKRNRGTTIDDVRANYGEGRVVSADMALSAGMIDRVMTFEELIGRLTGGASAPVGVRQDIPSMPRASAEVLRLRHQHRVKKKVNRMMLSDDQPRDELGRFAETDGPDDEIADQRSREDEDRQSARSDTDDARQAQRDKEDKARGEARDAADEKDLVDRAKEDAVIQDQREEEDGSIDNKRMEADGKLQDARDKEDEVREAANNKLMADRQAEDDSIQAKREQEDKEFKDETAKNERDRDAKDKVTQSVREREDQDRASRQIVERDSQQAQHAKELAELNERHAKENRDGESEAQDERHDEEKDNLNERQEKERDDLEERHDKENTAIEKARDKADAIEEAARDKQDQQRERDAAVIEKAREREDAVLQKKRDKEDADEEKKTDSLESARKREDLAIEKERGKEDAAISRQREREDAARQKERDKKDNADHAARNREDEAIERMRKEEDDKIEAARRAEDAAVEHARKLQDKKREPSAEIMMLREQFARRKRSMAHMLARGDHHAG